ncbi:SprT family zinc-dependent metalloprotease [Variovorax soli]|uniref:Metal-dependent hydrolase n=1 Tax=Variovorax soli TaxID=376815 RepID=A0ABU1N839_9BURK|nr:SprT family zinc-dependent metalloprotease [Variovorax soli]MDR6534605.1 putative metal-dependent hydrolase [Variovorax soli]
MSTAVLREFRYGDERIAFSVRLRPARKAQRIAIHVEPDGRVVVDVPHEASETAVQAAVRQRARWISSQLTAVRERIDPARPRAHAGGESLLYLGRRYRLEVLVDEDRKGDVRLGRGRIEVAVGSNEPGRVRAVLDTWYRRRAGEVLAARLAALAPALHWVRTPPPMQLRVMKQRWGSCSPAGRLTLNPNLIKASRECIDYVLIHELCHLQAHHHGPLFHRLLDAQMPEWRRIKQKLDAWADELIPS